MSFSLLRERSPAFSELLAKRVAFRRKALGRLNVNEPGRRGSYISEFNRAAGLINMMNAREREFYDFICRSFNELHADAYPLRAGARQRHWSALLPAMLGPGNRVRGAGLGSPAE